MIRHYNASIVLLVCVSICLANNMSANKCEEGWFGPECRYKCRCQESCTSEGECLGLCNVGWFGYKCQYHLLYDLEISFLDNNSVTVNAASVERILFQDNVVDIHISVDDYFINYIILEGKAIQRLCSLWVIEGQNVATKQNVHYSNSSISQIDTNLPQYPQASDGVYTCNENDTRNAAAYWEIVLISSFILKQYYFYFNDVLGETRYLTLQRFNNYRHIYDTFNYFHVNYYYSYYGVVTRTDTLTKAFTFLVTNASTYKNLALLLCEVEAITECREGTWGVQCTNTCNEKCPDLCRFDDGLCSNGCFGYSDPPKCTQECEPGTWGLNCTKTCSNQCFLSLCDSVTGVCDFFDYIDLPHYTSGRILQTMMFLLVFYLCSNLRSI
ncbi:uncharacterized protein LOC129926192 isoform X2 [Biomphalaria glabrata]|uniref:Uncharacterized protein LOC129926192 isoform X2 n=1 Tax=Biomphalaria glabrata TaxID=6526 RepID=A0A9W3ABQ1_BIOGL|nr:uncharacterized protein LOC129926192 isoform X2 [Biomphalaria glabrata]